MKKGVLKKLAKFTGKHLSQSLFFNKVAGLRPASLSKKTLWHRCFPLNFVKFLRTLFLQNTSEELLLNLSRRILMLIIVVCLLLFFFAFSIFFEGLHGSLLGLGMQRFKQKKKEEEKNQFPIDHQDHNFHVNEQKVVSIAEKFKRQIFCRIMFAVAMEGKYDLNDARPLSCIFIHIPNERFLNRSVLSSFKVSCFGMIRIRSILFGTCLTMKFFYYFIYKLSFMPLN